MGIETAIIGAAVAGAASSASASNKASSSAKAATAASSEATAAQLAFAKEQYADWKNVFGDVQENLASYYKNLTPDVLVATGVQNINKEYAQVSQQLTQSLAQRGISSSGLEGQAMVDLATKQAQDTANLKIQAPQMIANEKMKFLSLGLGQGTSTVAGVQNAYGTQAAVSAGQANVYNQQAAQASAGIGSSLSSGINSYMSYNAMNNQSALLKSALGVGGTPNIAAASGNLYTGATSLVNTGNFINW